jgi:hypothetical protein
MATNAEIIQVAKLIVSLRSESAIAAACNQMRALCHEPSKADKVIASLPACVAAAMLGDEDEADAWTDKEIL